MSGVHLYEHQLEALDKLKVGSVLMGGVGTGKSRTSLAWYYRECDGYFDDLVLEPMKHPTNLFIITTPKKRDSGEWTDELMVWFLCPTKIMKIYQYPDLLVTVDSWNNIKKYADIRDAIFIFDEQRVIGNGAWVKSFLRIVKHNRWILLSATPGDTYADYIPLFIANGFYRNRTEFCNEHVVWNPHTPYPSIQRFVGTKQLDHYRDLILVPMTMDRKTVPHKLDIWTNYDHNKYREVYEYKWNPYEGKPVLNASEWSRIQRRVVDTDPSKSNAIWEIMQLRKKAIIFYNYNYELDILRELFGGSEYVVGELNGQNHTPVPSGEKWVYLVQYTAGAEAWNCITTDTIVFYSMNYSWRVMAQSAGRIDRMNTPYVDLYYYYLKSHAPVDNNIAKSVMNKKLFNERAFYKKKFKEEFK